MAWVERLITRTTQPQDTCGVDWSNPLTKGLKLAVNPAIGSVNLVEQKAAAQSRDFAKISRPSGVSQTSGKAQYAATLDANSNLTLFSVWLARPAQYLAADALRILLSCRNASNQGWSWGRANTGVAGTGNAIGGDAITGNLTRQGFTFQGVAEYGQSTFTIPSLIATPVALRYVKSSGLLSWFSAGEKSQADTAASTNPSAGGGLVYGEQGVYGGNTGLWIDESLVTFAFARALSDAEIKSLSDNPWQIFEPEVSRIWVDDYVSAGGGVTVTTDASASYEIAGSIQADSAAQYQIASAVTADATASYAVQGSATADASAAYSVAIAVTADAAAQYAIRAAVTQDASASYSLISNTAVTADAPASYVVQGSATLDAEASYAVRAAVFADAVASYALITDGQVTADASAQYLIRGAVQSDASLAYELAGAVQADAAGAYLVQAGVFADAAGAYLIRGAAVVDAGGSYLVDGAVIVLQPSIHAAYVPLPRNQAYAPLAANQAYVPTPTNQAYLP